MIKLFHEMPLAMLQAGAETTLADGHYALVHMYEESDDYFLHSVKTLRSGRDVILDNSIFELGEAFDTEEFVFWIKKLEPYVGRLTLEEHLVYIIPDVLDDKAATLASARSFVSKYEDLPGRKMMVAQGKTYAELLQCYRELADLNPDRIGISFNCEAYNHENQKAATLNWMVGRTKFISMLLEEYAGELPVRLHLLGCSLPQEFKMYGPDTREFIRSIDTSNPVVHGIYKVPYTVNGLDGKLSIKLVELFDTTPDPVALATIEYNCKLFRSFVNG